MSNLVYKIVTKVNWSNFIKTNTKECKGFDNDLKDGFIHLSTKDQIYPTFINKYNLNDKNKYNLLTIDLNESGDVRWERAKNGIVYPHLYSPIIIDKNLLYVYGLENYCFDI